MFPLFNRHAASSAAYIEPAIVSGAPRQPAHSTPARENDASAAEQAATYDELLPYLMLAMAAAI